MKLSKRFKQIDISFFKRKIYEKGLIVFWPGHVGVTSKKDTLLHSNANSMTVCEENIHETLSRLRNKSILPSYAFKLKTF